MHGVAANLYCGCKAFGSQMFVVQKGCTDLRLLNDTKSNDGTLHKFSKSPPSNTVRSFPSQWMSAEVKTYVQLLHETNEFHAAKSHLKS
jgi:hypothetical protein